MDRRTYHNEGNGVVLAPLPIFNSVPHQERPDLDISPTEVSDFDERQRIFAVINSVRERDILTFEHSRRVAIYAQRLARALGMGRAEAARYALAGRLHDAGKSWIADTILNKTGELTPTEYDTIRAHVLIGERLAEAYDLPPLFGQAARSHHEAFDGSGYPDGLSGTEIPYVARVLAVVDAFDVMTSDRPYREATGIAVALAEMERGASHQFDPDIARTFIPLTKGDENFIVPARLCVVPLNRAPVGAWYQIATHF